jgi:hypothetical protein
LGVAGLRSRSPIRLVAPASMDHDHLASSRFGGFAMTIWVLKVTRFAARTIQVEPGQEVISSGPYRIVRHPMYLGGSMMFLFTPLALGSYFALPVFALLIPVIVLRLLSPRTARLSRILSPHPLPARPTSLVSDISLKHVDDDKSDVVRLGCG